MAPTLAPTLLAVVLTPTLAVTVAQSITPTVAVNATAVASSSPAPAEQQLTVTADVVNVRSAPDTAAQLIATATAGQQFPVTGQNPAGDWWQVCCFAGQA
ncbi:MAG TPA: SH3 domain-containing protein, partial [Caldilineaceae bacterium]|nr:SH3 domain-containing protein [Caldilineaceae bacterium]